MAPDLCGRVPEPAGGLRQHRSGTGAHRRSGDAPAGAGYRLDSAERTGIHRLRHSTGGSGAAGKEGYELAVGAGFQNPGLRPVHRRRSGTGTGGPQHPDWCDGGKGFCSDQQAGADRGAVPHELRRRCRIVRGLRRAFGGHHILLGGIVPQLFIGSAAVHHGSGGIIGFCGRLHHRNGAGIRLPNRVPASVEILLVRHDSGGGAGPVRKLV